MNNLFKEFLRKIQPNINNDLVEQLNSDLMSRYNENNRHYHTIYHIYKCLSDLYKITLPLQEHFMLDIPELLQLEYAIWYHDIVYDATKTNNENNSTLIAIDHYVKLQLDDPEFIDNVQSFILATSRSYKPQDIFEKYMCDRL